MNDFKFNILLLSNAGFMYCTKIFLNSLFTKVNPDRIDTVYVGDIGLDEDSLNFLNRYSKVVIIDAPKKTNFDGVHTENWVLGVAQKTMLLKQLIEEDKLPLMMIDADSIVTKDFSALLNTEYDIIVCRRKNPAMRADGLTMEYIGSFLYVKNKNALQFIDDWMREMFDMIKSGAIPAYESPALCKIIASLPGYISLGAISEEIVSCITGYNPDVTHIIHLKSQTSSLTDPRTDFMARVGAIQGFPEAGILQYLTIDPETFN